jgi:hypothetical protein
LLKDKKGTRRQKTVEDLHPVIVAEVWREFKQARDYPALTKSIAPAGQGGESCTRGSATGDILHWLVAKIPATTTSLPEGAGSAGGQLPAGARQIRTYAGPGAGPAGPPHHYTLTLHALSRAVRVGRNADRAAVMAAMGISSPEEIWGQPPNSNQKVGQPRNFSGSNSEAVPRSP